ncbi:MAG: hypothetical protein B7Z02_15100 [Rhodobacterales bacterium 32-67-9]|nr:MAG: hypothetical protein B7Z02_15100 [Rhodobacterales bacterium 32-67-9]
MPGRAGPRRPRRGNRGALFVIAVLLGSSGLIRIGTGAGHALANATVAETVEAAPDGPVCEPDAGALAMLEDLRAREARLAAREAQVEDRSQALTLAKTEIDEKLAALVAAEDKLAATLALADQAADQDVARLVAVYEKMKPKEAAPLFAEMDPDFAAGFLARMRPDTAAAVMAGLDPKAAYTISVLLAGRNANAPKN